MVMKYAEMKVLIDLPSLSEGAMLNAHDKSNSEMYFLISDFNCFMVKKVNHHPVDFANFAMCFVAI